jgi:gluconolactonase
MDSHLVDKLQVKSSQLQVASGNISAREAKLLSTIFDSLGIVGSCSKLDTLGKGFGFTEGPAVDKHGNVFFTD